jgi:3-oxoacyl-[acyl-carrier protein] reductase
MSSISGKVGNIGPTNCSTATAGLVGLTKASAKELAHVDAALFLASNLSAYITGTVLEVTGGRYM